MSDAKSASFGDTGRRPKLTAVVACYRDAEAVPIMHQRLTDTFKSIDVDYEIIFVNDGSPDNAHDVLSELAARDPKTVVITHSRAFGSQNAFSSGMRIATGDAVALLDGDLQDPPELLADFYHKWRDGYEVIYGERVSREASFFMRFAYKAFYRTLRKAAYVSVPLDAGDFSLLDRRVVDEINQMPETYRFVRGLRAYVGFRQIGVPYVRPERMFGTTTNSLLRNVGWARRGLVSMSYAPLDAITVLAMSVVVLSVIGAVAEVVLRIVRPSATPSGLTSLIIIVLFLGGVQLLCLSFIGFYIADIYTEVKRRPGYIVRDIANAPVSPTTTNGSDRP
ncbi:dolichol-phosphate mannosyltransferase [Frankineae bacterium MT45]|nr:dolichol-phosphate mannosyltransferase [Frankineae bacterium MT45]